MSTRRVLLWCFLASLSLTAVTGMAALLFDLQAEEQLLATVSLIAVYSLAALGGTSMLARRTSRIPAWASLVTLGLSLVGWLVMIWGDRALRSVNDEIVRTCGTLTLIGLWSIHLAGLRLFTIRRVPGRAARIGASVFGALALGIILPMIWGVDWDEDVVFRLLGVFLILATLGTFATPLLARLESLSRRHGADASVDHFVEVRLTCPRCASDMTVRANKDERCLTCGLRVNLGVEEPRCTCGYLLYGLTADLCPECGRPIPDDMRWLATARRQTHEPEGDDRSDGAIPRDARATAD
jgi:hypothetical protein